MTMEGLRNRRNEERVDVKSPIRPMSCNVPGHEDRMKVLCVKVQTEYFDSGLHEKEDRNWS